MLELSIVTFFLNNIEDIEFAEILCEPDPRGGGVPCPSPFIGTEMFTFLRFHER